VAFGLTGALAALSALIAVSTQRPFISGALAQSGSDAGPDPDLHWAHDPAEAPEPLYDGSVRPQDIPDSVAISVLMNSLRMPNESDVMALKQLRSKVGRVNLSEDDFAIMVGVLVQFDKRPRPRKRASKRLGPPTYQVSALPAFGSSRIVLCRNSEHAVRWRKITTSNSSNR
jgi:hypothetical protein